MTRRFRTKHPLATALGIAAAATALAIMASADLTGAQAPTYPRAPSYTVTTGPTVEDLALAEAMLFSAIAAEIPAGVLTQPVVVNLTDAEVRDLEEQQIASANRGPAVVGRTKSVGARVTFSDLDSRLINTSPRPTSVGVVQLTPDGGFIWAVALRSETAFGMRVHVSGLDLPGDADMYWMNMSGEIFGPYQGRGPSGDGDFWSHTIDGSEGVLVVRHFGPGGAAELRQAGFTIEDIGHVGPKFAGVLGSSPEAFCSYNESCIFNANCQSTGPAASAKNAVARMQWIAGAFIYTCTGGLISDAAPSSAPYYFLTANHCMSSNNNADDLETYFQYSIPCNSGCPGELNPGGIQRLGASVASTSASSDYTLLQLNQTPPSGSVFLGWNSAPIYNTDGADLHRISHPAWAPQAYSAHDVDTGGPTCNGIPRGSFIYSQDTFGATEGGSSGSPVVNAAGEIVGQLFGGCGFNINDVCDNVDNWTVDGAFAATYPNIQGLLGSGGGCTPTQNPETSCTDGLDNDCDGNIDAADSDCQGGGCTLGQKGDPCTSNAQCCSNSCKGKPGSKTCK